MIEYPYSSAFIIDDNAFVAYGGHTGSSTQGQRNAAYLIAEKRMTSHIGTFLKPTVVTGIFGWPLYPDHLVLPYSHVHSIKGVTVLDQEAYNSCDLDELEGCAFVWNDTYGYIDPRRVANYCACAYGVPYQIRVAWEAGLPTGTSVQADMLLSLTIVSEIVLNEIVDPSANEGVGDAGIEEFSNQQYREKRKKLRNTGLGRSARANFAADLVENVRKKRALKL